MSEIRLVRCPKCDKVLPEPPVFTVYQCGGCGALLKAKKKLSGSEKSGDSDSGFDKGVEGGGVKERAFGMDNRSPARSVGGDNAGSKFAGEESEFDEFHGGFPKSPMRDRFLNDLGSTPMRSRNVSPSPMRSRNVSPSPRMGRGLGDLDNEGFGVSPARSRYVSKSPVRERGSKSPMSVRTRNVSMSPVRGTDAVFRSPARGTDAVYRSPVRTVDGNISNLLDEKDAKGQVGMGNDLDEKEEEVRSDKMTPKTSFNLWLPDDNPGQESKNNNHGRRRKTWRNAEGDEVDKISEGKETVSADEYGMTSEGSVDDPVHESAFSKGKIDRDLRFRGDYVRGNGRPRVTVDQWYTGKVGDEVIHRDSRVVVETGRSSASLNSVSGTSSYHMDSIQGYGHTRHSFDTHRGSANVNYMEHLELIRGSNQQIPSKQFREMDESFLEEEYIRSRGGSMQRFPPENNIPSQPRHSYFNYGPGLHEREDMYNHSPLYDDPYAGQINRGYHPEIPQYPYRSRMGYVPKTSFNSDQDSLNSYRNMTHIDHPSCSCSLCEVGDWQGHDRPGTLGYRMPPNRGPHPQTSHSMNLQRRVPRSYDPRMAHTGPRERPPQLAPHHARRVMVASQNKRLCLPIAGGSPFVLCHSCFELLKLPGKFMTKRKKEYQLQCGGCSCIISFDLQNRSVGVLSTQKKPQPVYDAASGSGDGEVLNEPGSRRHRHSYGATSTSLGSYDFDATGSSFQSMESAGTEASRKQRLVSNFDEKARAISPSSRSSKEEHVSDSASVRSSPRNSSELPSKIRPPPGSPLRDHLDYSNHYLNIEADSAGYYTEKEKQVLEKNTSQDSSMVNTTVPSETEVYSHEFSTNYSDSGDISKENKDGNKNKSSSIPALLRDFASKSGRASPEVYVNGQQIPLHVVKKAEKLAGPIEPGDYWYDPKAGFWGVMGEHCLGIIPPSIQEFSFPMPEDCSQGDTSVYVNGRELQKRDLDLLTKRGLPTMKGKRYIVDMSGKVLEEKSKDFIVNLGKLAPTVEKNRHGFGMRVPERFDV